MMVKTGDENMLSLPILSVINYFQKVMIEMHGL